MTELIVALFDRENTANLARAALGRLQGQLSLPDEDLVMVTRSTKGRVNLSEPLAVRDADVRYSQETFWNALVRLMVMSRTSADTNRQTALAKLAAIGIDAASDRCFEQHLRAGSSALLVLVDEPKNRDRVLSVLHGFHGRVIRNTLKGDDRKDWLRLLSNTQIVEE